VYSYLLRKFILPCGDLLFNSYFSDSLKRINEEIQFDRNRVVEIQKLRLKEILSYASSKSVYYREVLSDVTINNVELSLNDFPILTKKIIKENIDTILTKNKKKLIKNSTSGSSGFQTDIYFDKQELSQIRAIQTIWWEWAGYNLGGPILQTGLSSKRTFEKKLKDFFLRTNYQFAFGLNNNNTAGSLIWSKRHKPFLGGYASSLYVLACLWEKENVKMRSAVSWGDKLFDHYKSKIRESFDCDIFETYGTAEGLMLAAQKDISYMYIMDPYYIVELLDDSNQPVADGEIGNVVVTSLIHKSMPLIRYKIGDLAIKLPKSEYPKSTELNFGILKRVIGRETDIVKTPNGNSLIVHSFTGVFEYFPQIEQFQVIQKKGELNLIIHYIPRVGFHQNILDEIKLQIESFAKEKLPIIFVEVDFIPNSPSGKPQLVRII
jgi:phenylacetate-CoA ligase